MVQEKRRDAGERWCFRRDEVVQQKGRGTAERTFFRREKVM